MFPDLISFYLLLVLFVSLTSSQVGCLIMWNKMTNVTEGFAHSMIVVMILTTIYGWQSKYLLLILAIIFASIIYFTKKSDRRNANILIVANSLTAFGILFAELKGANINLEKILFGNIFFSNESDLLLLVFLSIILCTWIGYTIKSMTIAAVSEDVAVTHGVYVRLLKLGNIILISCTVALLMKMVGAMLVAALCLIPPAIAARSSDNAPKMLMLSVIWSLFISFGGLYISFSWDLATGPAIIAFGFLNYIFNAVRHNI